MDAGQFDGFVQSLSERGSRRGVFGLLTGLPLLGGLAALVGADNAAAKGRRKRRKKAHKDRPGAAKQRHKGQQPGKGKKDRDKEKGKPACQPEATATTCAGTCGPVKNTCKQTVDCGPCTCDPPCGTCETCSRDLVCEPCDVCCNDVCCEQAQAICHADSRECCLPESAAQTCHDQCGDVVNTCGITVDCGDCLCAGGCPACQICDAEMGDCVADPAQQGQACGAAGQVCQSDGACACDASSCPPCATCQGDGTCSEPCGGVGCCEQGVCHGGTDTLCQTSADCCGEMVCGGPDTSPLNGKWVCHPNHAPVSKDLDTHLPLDYQPPTPGFPPHEQCYPITLIMIDPDPDWEPTILPGHVGLPKFTIVTLPEFGFFGTATANIITFDDGLPGTPAPPAPPFPADISECLEGTRFNGVPCAWGTLWAETVCYVPFSSTFLGNDSFTFRPIDQWGAKGPLVTAVITIFEI